MMETGRISDSEMKVMELLWNSKKMTSVAEITEILNNNGESWTHQTVGTFLKRLETKGLINSSKKGKSLYYFPLISKEKFMSNQTHKFLKTNFDGSLRGFLTAFSSEKKFSKEEIQDLKDWFDEIDFK